MTIQQATKQLLFQLCHIYDEREAVNIADLVMEKVTEWKKMDRMLNKRLELSAEKENLLAHYISELSNQKPVQYVLNEAWFYGMKLYVDEHVLIPRPETEELIDWAIEETRNPPSLIKVTQTVGSNLKGQDIRILDIGTGSGCIALALKNKLPLAEVYACDVSEQALTVARKNANANKAAISFIHCNFLNPEATNDLPAFDIIISNPPYIPLQDKSGMSPNVLLHEPHLALFVEDLDPLVFYKAIAAFAKTHINGIGIVLVEIHESMGAAVKNLFKEGFENIELKKDMQGKDRMVRASKL